ncbi:MAG: DUF2497 domain-containing protein [Sphingomonas bacterium]|nr:DUF2497 domain-containing protein [Sphingomonas bacterium]
MGDISAEPSMEEILSSIKRIIAEEGEGQPRGRRTPRPSPPPLQIEEDEDVADAYDAIDDRNDDIRGGEEPILELSDPMPEPAPERPSERDADRRPSARQESARLNSAAAPSSTNGTASTADSGRGSILSRETAAASRDSLATLSKLLVKPEPGSDGTLEGMIREMLRPMLREWLDTNLPDLVESLVAREIEKITGQSS